MFETLVTRLLTSALGSYIDPKCFSSDKINVAVWSGYVVLTELEVKPEVVAGLPAIKLVRGLVGSIELKIPWNRLQSDSVVATVDDVYLLLRTEEDIGAVLRGMDEFTLKKKMMEELYAQAKRQKKTSDDAEQSSNEDGFAARLVNKIIDNLELHIRRIHIRIEDHCTGEHPFAVGLTIESVHVQSTNSNWQPSYVDTSTSNEPRIYKIVDLNHLSVYCNPDCELQRDYQLDCQKCSAETFSSAFSRSIPKRFDDRHHHHMQLYPSRQQHHFILKPVDASARLIVNRDVFDANVPKFEVDVNVLEVAFRVEESQYCDMLYLVSALQIPDHYTKYQRYRKYRPQATILDAPAKWWKYAISSVVEDLKARKRQWTWEFIETRRRDRIRYVALWQHKSRQLLELTEVDDVIFDSDENDGDISVTGHFMEEDKNSGHSSLEYSDLPTLSPRDIDRGLEEIERRRSIEDVLLFRYVADLEVRNYQALRATRDRRRLPTPPPHKCRESLDTASVDTDLSGSSVPIEIRYRSWGAWIFGWTSKLAVSSANGEVLQSPRRIIPEVELRELFRILEEPSRRLKKRVHKLQEPSGLIDPSDSESLVELSELFRVSVTLQQGSLTLASDPETNKRLLRNDPSYGQKFTPTEFLLGTFSQLQLAAVAKDKSVVVDMSLQCIEAFDESAESSAFSRLLTRKQTIHSSGNGDDVNVSKLSGVVFLMSFETNPVNSSADASLFIHMEPLEIVMSPTAQCWGRLAQFMETPVSLGLWDELEVASFNNIVNLNSRTEAKLNYVMNNRIALAMDLRIQAPVIIVPESDTDYNCARLVVDLGRINLRTDRLCQMDRKRKGVNVADIPPSSRSALEFLRSPSCVRGVDLNTSFMQQLHDEAERGEGTIHWKEEFYDKFSISMVNIHVLLIPYGKTSRGHDRSIGMNVPSTVYMPENYEEKQKFELVERFNIYVTVRMSSLPLDATLTRFYVHADLPVLTFNLSLEKYYQLVALAGRFSMANTEVLSKSREYAEGAFDTPEDAFKTLKLGMVNSDDIVDGMRSGNHLTTSALKDYMLKNTVSSPSSLPGVFYEGTSNSDKDSSVESDDTWFSITSGAMDLTALAPSDGAGGVEPSLSKSDQFHPAATKHNGLSIPHRSSVTSRKRSRPNVSSGATTLLDRRFFVCSFTVPLIAVQLKKPWSSKYPSYAAYSYDSNDFDDDPADSGTIILKLQGFRMRLGQKTLSTQVNLSLTSLEVEDYAYAGGRSAQYLLFSCPTIAAPFSTRSPLNLNNKFPGYFARPRQPEKHQNRVILQGSRTKSSDGLRSGAFAAPETLLKLACISLIDQYSGKEVVRDVDIQLGSVQFIFDQTYVCSLLELFEDAFSQVTSIPGSSHSGLDNEGLPPPFELSPTIEQEYPIPVNLTESVRADLEQARKHLFGQAPDLSKAIASTGDRGTAYIALKLGLRLHSVSLCFSDRGESVASVAFLSSQLRIGTDEAGQITVAGVMGDMQVFDLSLMQRGRKDDEVGISDPAVRRLAASSSNCIRIFGLDTFATASMSEMRFLSVECLISPTLDPKSSKLVKQAKSRLNLSMQPVRLLAQARFMETLAKYIFDGPLRAHFQSGELTNVDSSVVERQHHKRTDSLNSDIFLASKLAPIPDHSLGSLTPFFDAVNASNKGAAQINTKMESPHSLPRDVDGDGVDFNTQCNLSNVSAKRDDVFVIFARFLNDFDLDITLCHPCVVFPTTSSKELRGEPLSSRGIALDFGTIDMSLQQGASESLLEGIACVSYQVTVNVDNWQISSVADQTAILDRSGFQMQCSISVQAVEEGCSIDHYMSTLPDIVLDLNVCPVFVNVSETNVCLAQEVYYETIISLAETARAVTQQSKIFEGELLADSGSLLDGSHGKDGHLKASLPAQTDATARWGRLTIRFILKELKIALMSCSEADQQFEMWTKTVNIPDISSSLESNGASFAAQETSSPQCWLERKESIPDKIPCCVIGEFAFVSLEADVVLGLNNTVLTDDQTYMQCDFSLQEATYRDKIADSTAFLTDLYGPVPGPLVGCLYSRTSIASDSSHLSRDNIFQALLRPSGSTQDGSSSQMRGQLLSKYSDADGVGSVVTMNSLEVSVSSARFILLPRTLLRLEHFVLNVLLAASKTKDELELQLYGVLAKTPREGVSTEYAVDTWGEQPESHFPVPPVRSRTDSISESLKDDQVAVRSALMSPSQCVLSSASTVEGRLPESLAPRVIVEETRIPAALNAGCLLASKAANNHKRLTIPQWNVNARLSNLQIWVVSTDRKDEVAGCVLLCDVHAKVDTVRNRTELLNEPNHHEVVNASALLSNVEVLVGLPTVGDTEQSKMIQHTGTLVESFEVNVQFKLRQCSRRPALENVDLDRRNENKGLKNDALELEVQTCRNDAKDSGAGVCVTTAPNKTYNSGICVSKLFLRNVPLEWHEWIMCVPTLRISQLIAHISYRDLPLLMKIVASLTNVLNAENKVRSTFSARIKAGGDESKWSDIPDASEEYSTYAHYFGAHPVSVVGQAEQGAGPGVQLDALTHMSVAVSCVQIYLINNIVDQASPVIEFETRDFELYLRAESNSMLEIAACCTVEAKYQNLRLVMMEPLIEPWSVQVTLNHHHLSGLDDKEQAEGLPWRLNLSSDAVLQLNLTDALIAHLVAADRAWRWVVNASGDTREMTEYSTYWIRNNTGMRLRYWGTSSDEHTLPPGQEEPLRFNKVVLFNCDSRDGDMPQRRGQCKTKVSDRQLFIAVEEEYSSLRVENRKSKWQSEVPIPVDQADSRMFALVDCKADIAATELRKCECVIDVVVERGCKYFVVRSTLSLENQTSSNLEVEFVASQCSVSRSPGTSQEPTIPMWTKVVKAFSIVPVPVHIVSYGEGYVRVRPCKSDIHVAEAGTRAGLQPRVYAKERVHLPLFDRSCALALEKLTQMASDESGQAQCTIKFRRLYQDRPVRPFMMNVGLSSASDALYHRTLSFYPPLIVHNLTAGPLDYCLATPSDWSPVIEAVAVTNAGINAGWETREQRLRERGTINVADSLIWHLSSEATPLVFSVRMKGFEWSQTLELSKDLPELVRISLKDLVSEARLYISADIRISKGHCRELFLYAPYWIVNLTSLKLEYEYERDRMGPEHSTTSLAGQKRLNRDELLLKESQSAKAAWRDQNPHLVHPVSGQDEVAESANNSQQRSASDRNSSSNRREIERKRRRYPRLLPSAPPIKGLLDLLPQSMEYNPRSLGQLEILQACHSDYSVDRGYVRLRVSTERETAAATVKKDAGQRKWSDPFVLDQVGTSGEIEAIDYEANRKFCIGYSIFPAKGHFSRTKVIMLTPRFVLVNTMSSAVEVCHSSSKVTPSEIDTPNDNGPRPRSGVLSPANHVVQLEAGAFADFHWTLRFAKTRTIRCRLSEYGWSWSGAVPLVESGEYAVRMRHESTRDSKFVRITLKLDPPCVCVYFREERTTTPPYRVENYSLETLRTHQNRVRRSEVLLPHHSLEYAWDEPTEERLLVVDMLPSAAGDNSRPLRIGRFDLDRIQRYPDALGGTLGIEISTDGPTRVLRFTDTRLRGEKAGHASTKNPSEKTETTDSKALHLFQRYVTAPTVHAVLHLQGVSVSIVDNAPKELVYISVSGIALEVLISRRDRNHSIPGSGTALSRLERETQSRILACCLEVDDLQIDNQLHMTPYPVLLRFSKPSGRSRIVKGRGMSIPVLHVGLVKHDEYAGIEFIRHFSVSMLPVHVRVDGALLYHMLSLLVHFKRNDSSDHIDASTNKKTDVLRNGDSGATRAAHSHVLLKEFHASLKIPVKVLEAAQKDNSVSAEHPSGTIPPTTNIVFRTNSARQQPIIPGPLQRTALVTEIQRSTAAKYGNFCVIVGEKAEQKKLYFEDFCIDPIRATVSFSFGDSAGAIVDGRVASRSHAAALSDLSSSQDASVITVGPLRLILSAIGTSLSKIANAPFHLKALHIHNSFVQPDALATRLVSHYQSEALRQAYVILGSVDVLGNPMIAWKNMRTGFHDFLSKPVHGLLQRSPQAFAAGLGQGALSLVRASVYTFLDFNTRILTAFSLGLSEACIKLDDYTGYPATRHIFQGFVQGVSGVVVAPIHSFEVNGARGLIPGLIAGMFGLVLKPLLGFSLATATTVTTLRDAIDPNTKALWVRVRPPRHIDLRTKRLKIYSYVDSLGEEIVSKICGGRYRADGYVGHIDLKATHQCFLVTRKRLLLLNVKGTASIQTTKYEVEWELLAEEIVLVDCSRTLDDQMATIYYMEDEFHTASGARSNVSTTKGSNSVATSRCRSTRGRPRGMFVHKHEVTLPQTKVLFVRAMLQQQDHSLLTKMNNYTTDRHVGSLSLLARTNSMEINTMWRPHVSHASLDYPMFRIPLSLAQTRSFTNLAQRTPSPVQNHID